MYKIGLPLPLILNYFFIKKREGKQSRPASRQLASFFLVKITDLTFLFLVKTNSTFSEHKSSNHFIIQSEGQLIKLIHYKKRGPYRRFIGPRIGGIFRRNSATAFWQNAYKFAVEMRHLGVLENAYMRRKTPVCGNNIFLFMHIGVL